jgi:hypothetical protein
LRAFDEEPLDVVTLTEDQRLKCGAAHAQQPRVHPRLRTAPRAWISRSPHEALRCGDRCLSRDLLIRANVSYVNYSAKLAPMLFRSSMGMDDAVLMTRL